jgi:UDP-N-acetylglucosamine/UDP-N-acetylgalactosamine 4-epimerase
LLHPFFLIFSYIFLYALYGSIFKNMKILITGGAGFIGSNLVEYFLKKECEIICLDNLVTGYMHNIEEFITNPKFTFIEGDIRNLETCKTAAQGCDYVLHQAALGSVPRSINDPANTNSVNIDGFLNMLIAARDEGVKRFVYAASSSTYGDSKKLPKTEDKIGKPLSPYAITKYVNELYADVFAKTYNMQCIGLRYFNVFGKRQDPKGAYAAVIPLWVKKLLNHEKPVINGDGTYSRDFTYIENVIQANELAVFTPSEIIIENREKYFQNEQIAINNKQSLIIAEVFNVAFGGNTNLIQLFEALRDNLAKYDTKIGGIQAIFGPNRTGDIPHSQASILKANTILGYNPKYDAKTGFEKACEWYFNKYK